MNESPENCSAKPKLLAMLSFDDAAKAIDWYIAAFGAKETARLKMPDGKIGYSEIWVEKANFSAADLWPDLNNTPQELGGTPVVLNLQVEDADAFFARAIKNGAKEIIPVKDQFYGDRAGRIQDPFGYVWIISTTIEEVSVEEMQKRIDEMTNEG